MDCPGPRSPAGSPMSATGRFQARATSNSREARMTLVALTTRFSSIRAFVALVGLSLIGAGATGCVSTEKYQARGLQGAQLAEQLASAQRSNSELLAQN